MFSRWAWISSCLWLQSVLGHIQQIRDLADLETRISKEVLSDFLLLKSGKQCGRCMAIESFMKQLEKYILVPIFIWRDGAVRNPVLELHKLSDRTDGYEIIPYEGYMSTTGILKFMQDITSARNPIGPHPLKNREVEDIDTAIERSRTAGGRVPFIFEVRNDEDLLFYEDVLREADLVNADFYFRKRPKSDKPRIVIAHRDEARLTTTAASKPELVRWLRLESLAQFGEIRQLTQEQKNVNKAWILLIGAKDSYNLFQHEFRDFASRNRDHWRAGWINKDKDDWEVIAQDILNIAEDLATFGRHIDEEGTASWNCQPDCVIGRDDNVIKYMSTSNLSANKLAEFAHTFSGKKSTELATEKSESQVPDLKVEFESREQGIIRLNNRDFNEKIRQTSEAVLILLRAADGEKSVELRSVLENVADILSPATSIRFYELIDLPPPDERYAAYDTIPHLWFKPIGIDEDPIAIPWQTAVPSEDVISPSELSSRQLAAAVYQKLRDYARTSLIKLKSVLEHLISSLNNNQEL